ncbi:MAG: hypothetical protein U5N55_06700 [Cypionkella sp.]|nr:hypothetical protein [Cypionkella sp.]
MIAPILNFYIPPWLLDRVDRAGTIFGRVKQAAQLAGWELALHKEDDAPAVTGYHLVYNRPVTRPNTLVLRKCGFEPFFRIEATNDRWDWHVANAPFATEKGGEWFRRYWQGELFKGLDIGQGGYAFMPLQGRLLQQRHFQTASPIEMIETALARDSRPIKASLHPREIYKPAELAAIAQLERASGGRFTLSQSPSMQLLAGCDYVITQNSTMALIGMFAQKTPILFAKIDFHHLAGSVPHLGLDSAYAGLASPRKWGAYLHWYFKENAITTRDNEAPAQIVARLNALGWPISA